MKAIVGIAGFGAMGSAIAGRIAGPYDVRVFDRDVSRTAGASGVSVCGSVAELLACPVLVIAVKPQDISPLLEQLVATQACVISICAGITTSSIERILRKARVIRVMPNLAVKVGRGMSCLARGASASPQDLDAAKKIFKKLGAVLAVNEDMLNAVTAVSGSGPGFFFEMVQGKSVHEARMYGLHVFGQELMSAARSVGFNGAEAKLLAETTVDGSIALLKETGLPPAQLRDSVTSKGGTTEAGLNVLRETGSLTEAVRAAQCRAAELAT